MKKTVISLLLVTVIICSIFVNVFAAEDPNPYSIKRDTEIIIADQD